jgi:hypothetical protein
MYYYAAKIRLDINHKKAFIVFQDHFIKVTLEISPSWKFL